jgi:hypothetical protein
MKAWDSQDRHRSEEGKVAMDKGMAGKGFLAAVLALGLFPAACDSGGEAGTGPGGGPPHSAAEDALVGKWVLRKYHSEGYLNIGGMSYPLDADTAFTDDNCYIHLQPGRAFVSDLPDSEGGTKVEVGSWSFAAGTLTTIGSEDALGEPDTVKWTVSISGMDGSFSSHTEVKDSLVELREVVLIDAVKR